MNKTNKYNVSTYALEWIVYIIAYALVLVIVSHLFPNTFYIDNSHWGFYPIVASLIIATLNVTIKPFLVFITLPVTAITLGIFYPIINVMLLKIVDWILGSHFEIKGFFMAIVVAVIISLFNKIIKESIIKPILKGDTYE